MTKNETASHNSNIHVTLKRYKRWAPKRATNVESRKERAASIEVAMVFNQVLYYTRDPNQGKTG